MQAPSRRVRALTLGLTAQLPWRGGCHSFSSNLARSGIDDRIIDHFMGRQAKEMRPRYQRLLPKERRKAPRRLDCWSVCPLCAKDADGEDSWCATACPG